MAKIRQLKLLWNIAIPTVTFTLSTVRSHNKFFLLHLNVFFSLFFIVQLQYHRLFDFLKFSFLNQGTVTKMFNKMIWSELFGWPNEITKFAKWQRHLHFSPALNCPGQVRLPAKSIWVKLPNCYRIPIPKLHLFMLLGPQKMLP